MMWPPVKLALRRGVLLVPLLLTAVALLLLPRALPPQPATVQQPPHLPPQHDFIVQQIDTPEDGNNILKGPQEQHENMRASRPWYMRGGRKRPTSGNNYHQLFPDEAPNKDRITNQLMYALPDDEDVPEMKILIANGLSAFNAAAGRTEFTRNKCPVSQCTLTDHSIEADTADAILFKDHFKSITHTKRPPKQIWILYYLECPYHTSTIRSHFDAYNWTATYRQDSDIVTPYERWVYHDPLVQEREQERNYAANKTKQVAWFVSNCHARNQRLKYARKLSRYISVDIYGACGTHHCPRNDPNCLEMLDKEYKFYLAFENSNCKDYITEKFFVNGLQHDVIPIVMGARPAEYAAVAPHHSYIHVEDFASPKDLANYLKILDGDDTLYNSYFKWKGTGEFINTYFFCRVCAMLHANRRKGRGSNYEDVQAWWRDGTCTRGTWTTQQRENKASENIDYSDV